MQLLTTQLLVMSSQGTGSKVCGQHGTWDCERSVDFRIKKEIYHV